MTQLSLPGIGHNSPEFGPKTEFSQNLHAEKYRSIGESFEEAMQRVASTLSENSSHESRFLDCLLDMRFLPAGRIQAAIGSPKKVTAYNCFVSGNIEDDFVGARGIMARATEAAQTMRMGGGMGYDFSTLRPRGDRIKSLDSQASGPVSFMEIYDAVCRTVASSGHRRGAQMGVLRVDHPDIEEFIRVKHNEHKLNGFNISVGITDSFMDAVKGGTDFWLSFGGRQYKSINARALWEEIMRSTWDWAEPGVLFLDRINEYNNLWYCENITATNPCSEQPLPANGACLLGSFNLVKYVELKDGNWTFNYSTFISDINTVIRAMDNVVDVSIYPLDAQRDEAISKRRMGLGISGFANASELLGFPYSSKQANLFLKSVLSILRKASYTASALIAREKGSFPLFDKEKYLQGKFIQTLDDETKGLINEFGIRNSHLISIAPTGTISLTADNISSGIEPVFSYSVERTIQSFDGPKVVNIEDYNYREHGIAGRKATELSADEHLNTLLISQRYVDSAVYKTCNVSPQMPWQEFKDLYFKAWEGGAKGLSTFQPGGKRQGILVEREKEDESVFCTVDDNGQRSCS